MTLKAICLSKSFYEFKFSSFEDTRGILAI